MYMMYCFSSQHSSQEVMAVITYVCSFLQVLVEACYRLKLIGCVMILKVPPCVLTRQLLKFFNVLDDMQPYIAIL